MRLLILLMYCVPLMLSGRYDKNEKISVEPALQDRHYGFDDSSFLLGRDEFGSCCDCDAYRLGEEGRSHRLPSRSIEVGQIESSPEVALGIIGGAILTLFFIAKRSRKISASSNKPIQLPPSFRLKDFAEFFFSRRTFETILEPTLRDLFDEYCEALAANRLWKARWVRIRGYWSFWSAVFAQLPISAVKMVYKIWQATR
jgi:hypothetical protein